MASINNAINKKRQQIGKSLNRLPVVLGNAAVNWSLERFKAQNWIGSGVEAWPKRKSGKNSRQLLIQTGQLRRGVKIIDTSPTKVVIGNNVPYAKAHNFGFKGTVQIQSYTRRKYAKYRKGTGLYSTKTKKEGKRTYTAAVGGSTVRAHSRRVNIPRRQFMGNSPYVRRFLIRQGQLFIIKTLK